MMYNLATANLRSESSAKTDLVQELASLKVEICLLRHETKTQLLQMKSELILWVGIVAILQTAWVVTFILN
jgi:hypothetical protein